MCLDAATGVRKWHFQIVHHGLWDYDNPSPPNLVTIRVDGRTIDAVVQLTKQGFAFVFDRVTGKPVWPIEERPRAGERRRRRARVADAAVSDAGRRPFTEQGVTLDDAIDLTPELKAAAQQELKKYRLGPVFTPPSLRGTRAAARADRRRELGRRRVRSGEPACCSSRRRTRRTSRGWGSRTRPAPTRARLKWTPS